MMPSGSLPRNGSSGVAAAGPGAAGGAATRQLGRCKTSQYTTLHTITLDDLQCQVGRGGLMMRTA